MLDMVACTVMARHNQHRRARAVVLYVPSMPLLDQPMIPVSGNAGTRLRLQGKQLTFMGALYPDGQFATPDQVLQEASNLPLSWLTYFQLRAVIRAQHSDFPTSPLVL
ncbi:hypothetical protein NDU88_008353 [Pleurodeles waltl]|uniref:Uncharacterized protein n=1 Tax=Pleurodeles waltl TaxID=8319 RepID=A0AAV7RS35_PLEWA|nr:hypothetical protein NDU88_008353 [Pleurodeles waltl]